MSLYLQDLEVYFNHYPLNYLVTQYFHNDELILFGSIGDDEPGEERQRHLRIESIRKYYKVYNIVISKGHKRRRIEQPIDPLLTLQKKLLSYFEKIPLHSAAHACKGRSAITNAIAHKDAKHVLQLDIKNCYQSIQPYKIRDPLAIAAASQYIFNKFSQAISYCIYQPKKNVSPRLPTGAPTSPILCNIALITLDKEIQALADEFGYTYTRYVDDITLSTTSPTRNWELLKRIEDLILASGLYPNYKKSRWLQNNDNDNLIITGVRVQDHIKVPRKLYRQVRAILNNLAIADEDLDDKARGYLSYIKSIEPDKYNRLMDYYRQRRNVCQF